MSQLAANVEGNTNSGDNSQTASSTHNDDNQAPFTAAAEKQTNTEREKIKGREEYRQNIRH